MRTTLPPAWRGFPERLGIAVALVGSLTAGSIGGAYWWADHKVDSIEDAAIAPETFAEPPVGEGEAANFLIVGSDTREFVDTADDVRRFGDPETEKGRRSDTLMIAHVDPEAGTNLLVSLPRDLWVEIPGVGETRINAAYQEGPQKVVETIQHNFGVPIHHYLEVDFVGFRGIVEAIGTVPIFFPTPARDEWTGLAIPLGGCVELNGDQALDYARSRRYEWYDVEIGDWRDDPTSDFGRIRRQQYFLRSLAQAAIDRGARDPLKAYRLLDEVVQHLVKDEALGLSDLRALLHAFREVDPASLEMVTVPAEEALRGQAQVLELVEEEAEPIFERLRQFEAPEETAGEEPPPDLAPDEVRAQVLNGSGVGVPGATATTAAPTTLAPNPGTLPGVSPTRDPNSGLPWVGC